MMLSRYHYLDEHDEDKSRYLPLWVLLIGFAAVADWLSSKLDEAIVELAMRPVVLWIRCVSQAKGGKLDLLQTSWTESDTAKGSPECLAVGGQVALAGGAYRDENHLVLQQLLLPRRQLPAHVPSRRRAYPQVRWS
jgi:hypothetical protein